MGKKLNIPYGRQNITDEDIKEVERVLRSDFLTQGPEVPKFEKNFSNFVGSNYAVAVNSATSALHLSCLALGVKEGDIVWTSAVSFVASANCALYCGASIDFIDIDDRTSNISISSLKSKLKISKKNNTLPKVIIAVHLSGLPCDMTELSELASVYGFKIIEDASHASGGFYKTKPIGSCQFSDISVFSFHPVKNLTSGEGGMVTTNSEEVSLRIKQLREHGINKDPKSFLLTEEGPWYYEQTSLGFNYRMTDIHAALGNSQLNRLVVSTRKRHEISSFYDEKLDSLPLKLPYKSEDSYSGMHLYVIRIDTELVKLSHKSLFIELRDRGIGVNLHYIPIYRHPFYKQLGFDPSNFPISEKYYSSALSIPMFPELNNSQLSYVVKNLKELIK